jgi:hypothetical protein
VIKPILDHDLLVCKRPVSAESCHECQARQRLTATAELHFLISPSPTTIPLPWTLAFPSCNCFISTAHLPQLFVIYARPLSFGSHAFSRRDWEPPLPDDQPPHRIWAILQEGRGAEHLLKNDAISLSNGANMADSPQSSSRRTTILVSISIALFSILLTFYAPHHFQQQQHKMSTIKTVAVIGVCQTPN